MNLNNFLTLHDQHNLIASFLDVEDVRALNVCSPQTNDLFTFGTSRFEMLPALPFKNIISFLNNSEIKNISCTSSKLNNFIIKETHFNFPYNIERFINSNPFTIGMFCAKPDGTFKSPQEIMEDSRAAKPFKKWI